MARFYKHLISYLFPLTSCLFIACQEGREAGDLLGQWRLDGSDTQYIRFSGAIVSVADLSTVIEVFGNFQHTGDSLFIQCYSINGEAADTAVVEQTFGFRPMNDVRLKMEQPDGDHLVLLKGERTWNFRKY